LADNHAVARSIRRLAIDAHRHINQRKGQVDYGGMAEREEQFQIKLSGIAADYPAWATAFLPFETVFTPSNGRRQNTVQRPQVAVGYELISTGRVAQNGTYVESVPEGIMLTGAVRGWHFGPSDVIDGADVSIAAFAPGDQINFVAFVHFTFQGFGTPNELTDEAP
jgi:hypothetical protein